MLLEEGVGMQAIDRTHYRNMHKLLEDMDSTTPPQDLCSSILRGITEATGSRGCSLMLFTKGKKVLFRCAAYGLSDWFFKKCTVTNDQGISQALKGKSTVKNVASDPKVGYRKQVIKEGIASILNVPVKLRGKIIGVMQIYTSDARNFTDNEISFASVIADFAAEALDKAGFFEIMQRDYEAFNKSMRQIGSELDYEWKSEPEVEPFEDKGPVITAGG